MNNNSNSTEQEAVNNYYDLKTDAIDALVNAEQDDGQTVSQEELDAYRGNGKFKIPEFIKIAFIKFWFAGAVYYFIGFGLGITNLLDQVFVLAVALGMVTDLLSNNVIRFLEETPGANDKWIVFAKKGYMSFVLNLIYGFAVVICVACIYLLIELTADVITGDPALIHIGTEPVLFGVFCMAVDMLFLGIKQLIQKVLKRIRK